MRDKWVRPGRRADSDWTGQAANGRSATGQQHPMGSQWRDGTMGHQPHDHRQVQDRQCRRSEQPTPLPRGQGIKRQAAVPVRTSGCREWPIRRGRPQLQPAGRQGDDTRHRLPGMPHPTSEAGAFRRVHVQVIVRGFAVDKPPQRRHQHREHGGGELVWFCGSGFQRGVCNDPPRTRQRRRKSHAHTGRSLTLPPERGCVPLGAGSAAATSE